MRSSSRARSSRSLANSASRCWSVACILSVSRLNRPYETVLGDFLPDAGDLSSGFAAPSSPSSPASPASPAWNSSPSSPASPSPASPSSPSSATSSPEPSSTAGAPRLDSISANCWASSAERPKGSSSAAPAPELFPPSTCSICPTLLVSAPPSSFGANAAITATEALDMRRSRIFMMLSFDADSECARPSSATSPHPAVP